MVCELQLNKTILKIKGRNQQWLYDNVTPLPPTLLCSSEASHHVQLTLKGEDLGSSTWNEKYQGIRKHFLNPSQ